ncbi:MAG: hypothetical protein JJU29_13450 [Verrucomicrobia bacterium]|nr:hypothetical protein [Verrucomicrobiota bacterium]
MSKLEGTVQIGGLFEGPLTSEGEAPLQTWRAQCRHMGFYVDVSTDGSLFSVIPHSESFQPWRGKACPDETIRGALESLLGLLDSDQQRFCMSTIRSAEILPGMERQTVYTLGPGGTLQVEQRDVDASTVKPKGLQNPAQLKKNILYAALALILIIGITVPFVPYKAWFQRGLANITRVSPETLVIDTGPFSAWIQTHPLEWNQNGSAYRLFFDFDPDRIQRTWRDQSDLSATLAAEDLIRGRLQIEIRDVEGNLLQRTQIRTQNASAIENAPGRNYLSIPPIPRAHSLHLTL